MSFLAFQQEGEPPKRCVRKASRNAKMGVKDFGVVFSTLKSEPFCLVEITKLTPIWAKINKTEAFFGHVGVDPK